MSGQQQQQQSQKGGNQQKPAQAGLAANLTIAPNQITDKAHLSDIFLMGAGLAVLAFGFRWVAPVAKQVLFGVKAEDGPSLNSASANDIVSLIKGGNIPAGGLKYIGKELLGHLDPADKENVISASNKPK